MSTQHLLHVINIQDVRWNSRFRSKLPDLYVLARLGDVSKQTQVVKRNLSPTWNELLTISSSDPATDLVIELKHKSILKSDPCVGYANIKLDQLLNVNTEDEANGSTPVFLHKKGSNDPAGTLHLRLEIVDLMSGVGNDIQVATQDIQRLKQTEAGALTTTGIANSITQPSTGSNLYTSIADLLSKLGVFIKLVDELSKIHPYLTVAWQVASFLYKGVSNQFKADKEIIDLFILMVKAFNFVRDADSLPNKSQNLEETIISLLKQTTECCLFVKHYVRHGFVGRMLDFGLKEKVSEFSESFIALKNALDSGISLHTAFVSARILDKVDAIHLQLRLNPDKMNAFDRPLCLPGTRIKIQKQIIDWMLSDTDQNIFWLHGVAGAGKSTISTTIAEHFRGLHRLGAFIFFERGKSDPSSVIRTLSFGIACADSNIAKQISIAIELDHGIASASATSQFDALILKPLIASAEDLRGPILIVLDALDECGTLETRRTLMELFRERISSIPKNIRILITSRRETDIERALSSQPDTVQMAELDYTSEDSRRDVLAYLRVEMARRVKDEVVIPEDWPWEANMKLLADAAEGLFVWASTAVKLVSSHMDDPFQKLKDIVTDLHSPSAFGLNDLYSNVLRNCGISWDSGASRARFSQVLGLILFSKTPLSIATIDGILGFSPEKSSRLILSRLQCLLAYSSDADTPIRFFHSSFSDYLMSSERSFDPWFIDIPSQMTYITMRCFSVMKDMLHFNMCNLESSFVPNDSVHGLEDRTKQSIPPHLAYACLHWSHHLSESSKSPLLQDTLAEFAYYRLLYWFEVLSLLKKVKVGDLMLLDALQWTGPSIEGLSNFLTDARRLLMTFGMPISYSTPHIYMSMLPLTSVESRVSAHYFKSASSLVSIERSGDRGSTPLLQNFRLETDDHMREITISPDCTRIAFGSFGGSINIWDIESRTMVSALHNEFTDTVWSMAFSPDGSRMVSGLGNRAIKIWSESNGENMAGLFEGHTDRVMSVIFSPDGNRIASGSFDGVVFIWDSWNGVVVSGPLRKHTTWVSAVDFSPDGSRVVSGSADWMLILWDTGSGQALRSFEGHKGRIICVNFSADGARIVSGSEDQSIRIWNAFTGKDVCEPLRGHAAEVRCARFSPDGSRIVSAGNGDKSAILWNAENGKEITRLFMWNTGRAMFASFSLDGTRIILGSDKSDLWVWDVDGVETGSGLLEKHPSGVLLVAYTSDGSRIASVYDDYTIRFWNVHSGEVSSKLLSGNNIAFECVTFSPDGTRLALVSYDGTIRICDTESGEEVSLLNDGNSIRTVHFSPDGTQLVSGSEKDNYSESDLTRVWDIYNTVKVWDVESGKLLCGPFEVSGRIYSVIFSTNGTHILSCLVDGTIETCDMESGEILASPFEGHTEAISSIVFSPCGTRLASGSYDNTVIIWDFESGQVISTLNGHTDVVTSLSFSPDGLCIASGSEDKTVRIWDVISGEPIFGPFTGHSGSVNSVTFSPSGTNVVSGSLDGIIRVWDVTAGETSLLPPNWVMDDDHDGWVRGGNDELLLWVPPTLRTTMWHPRNTALFGGKFQTKLDFANCVHGGRWQECFQT